MINTKNIVLKITKKEVSGGDVIVTLESGKVITYPISDEVQEVLTFYQE